MRANHGRQCRTPRRSCVACRTTRDKRDLVRIVRTPDGHVVLDKTGRLSGRGAYLCADGSCWSIALQRGVLGRALNAQVPADLRDQLAAGPAFADSATITSNTNTDQGDIRGEK